jgi:Mg2+ and Co2+ transporter CorA
MISSHVFRPRRVFVARAAGLVVAMVLVSIVTTSFAQDASHATREEFGAFNASLITWLLALVALLQVVGFFKRKPALEAEFATKAEVQTLRHEVSSDIASLREQIREDYENVQRSSEARVSGLHNRMNAVVDVVSTLNGTVTGMRDQVGELIKRAMRRPTDA